MYFAQKKVEDQKKKEASVTALLEYLNRPCPKRRERLGDGGVHLLPVHPPGSAPACPSITVLYILVH